MPAIRIIDAIEAIVAIVTIATYNLLKIKVEDLIKFDQIFHFYFFIFIVPAIPKNSNSSQIEMYLD